jgi:hypothetical protein
MGYKPRYIQAAEDALVAAGDAVLGKLSDTHDDVLRLISDYLVLNLPQIEKEEKLSATVSMGKILLSAGYSVSDVASALTKQSTFAGAVNELLMRSDGDDSKDECDSKEDPSSSVGVLVKALQQVQTAMAVSAQTKKSSTKVVSTPGVSLSQILAKTSDDMQPARSDATPVVVVNITHSSADMEDLKPMEYVNMQTDSVAVLTTLSARRALLELLISLMTPLAPVVEEEEEDTKETECDDDDSETSAPAAATPVVDPASVALLQRILSTRDESTRTVLMSLVRLTMATSAPESVAQLRALLLAVLQVRVLGCGECFGGFSVHFMFALELITSGHCGLCRWKRKPRLTEPSLRVAWFPNYFCIFRWH